jgi:hypothetical protein
VADDGDLASSFDGAGQGERTHGAADRPGDDVPRVTQPDELVCGDTEYRRHKGIQPCINASQRHQRKGFGEIGRVQAGMVVSRHGAMIRIDDGFKQAHGILCLFDWAGDVRASVL